MMKVANRICVWTRTAMTTFLPITGTSRLPIGTARSFLTRREVHDPAHGQKHIEHHDHDHQDAYDRGEGPADGVVVLRATVEPRNGEEEPDKDRRHDHGPEGDERVAGEEHEHLLVEEEEPFGPRHVGDGRRVGRLGERRGRGIGEHDARNKDKGTDVAVLSTCPGKNPMVSSGRSNTFSSVITSSSTGLALPVAGVYTFYTSSLYHVPYRNRTSGTSAFSVKAVTHRLSRSLPCPRGRGGQRRAPLRPHPSRSGRTLRGAVFRAASQAYPCTRTRCRTPRDA